MQAAALRRAAKSNEPTVLEVETYRAVRQQIATIERHLGINKEESTNASTRHVSD